MPPISRVALPSGLGMGNAPGLMVSIDWSPTPVILAASYAAFGMSFRSMHEPLKRSVQQVLAPSIRRNFDVGGRPPWQALSQVTIDMRLKMGFSAGPVLVRSGKLKRVAGQLNIWTIDTEKAFVSDLRQASYGIVHQQGASFTPSFGKMSAVAKLATRRGGKVVVNHAEGAGATRTVKGGKRGSGSNTIPARPFLLIQDEDVAAVEEVFITWVRERAAATGFRPGI